MLESAVIGITDGDGLTKTKAFVVLGEGQQASAEDLKAFVKDRLAPYKYPRHRIHRRVAEDRHRQDPALPPAGPGSRSVNDDVDFVDIDWEDRPVRIEYRWIDAPSAQALIVFLHEGLGSLAMWKDFPDQLCQATNCRGLVYSRPGYGGSTPRCRGENWDVDFMHRQAYTVLPAFLDAVQVDAASSPPWLFGHSDGASIAMLYAAAYPARVAGVIALAPHIMVEDLTINSIEQARTTYLDNRFETAAGTLPRRSGFGLLGLERYLVAGGLSRLEHRGGNRLDRMPIAGGAGY